MKHTLLILLSICFIVSANAQRVHFANAKNAGPLKYINSNNLSVNSELGIIAYSSYNSTSLNNNIVTRYSLDNGATWDSVIVYNQSTKSIYPSSTLFNPSGNTDPKKAYSIAVVPLTVSGNDIDQHAFCSKSLDPTVDDDIKVHIVPQENNKLERITQGITTTDDGKIRILATNLYDKALSESIFNAKLYTGTWDNVNDSVLWTSQELNIPFLVDSIDNNGTMIPSHVGRMHGMMAWSKSGEYGYIVFFGYRDSLDSIGYSPIVYKTSDFGANWNLLDAYDFSQIQVINEHLTATNTNANLKIASFVPVCKGGDETLELNSNGDYGDVSVDYQGNLHIACRVVSRLSENSRDTLETFNSSAGYFYDVYTINDNSWGAIIIDTVFSKDAQSDQTPFGLATNTRLQIIMSENEKVANYVWLETDITQFGDYNTFPDLYSMSYDIENNSVSTVYIMSAGETFETDVLYLQAGTHTYFYGGNEIMPIVSSTLTGAKTQPIYNYYYPNLYPIIESGVGISENEKDNSSLSLSPNPASNYTKLNYELKNSSNVEISVYNLVGTKVYNKTINNQNAGNYTEIIKTENLPSGLYICNVRTNDLLKSNKLVIE